MIFFQYFLTYVVQISSCSTYCTQSKLVLYLCSKTSVSAKGFAHLCHTQLHYRALRSNKSGCSGVHYDINLLCTEHSGAVSYLRQLWLLWYISWLQLLEWSFKSFVKKQWNWSSSLTKSKMMMSGERCAKELLWLTSRELYNYLADWRQENCRSFQSYNRPSDLYLNPVPSELNWDHLTAAFAAQKCMKISNEETFRTLVKFITLKQ